jgi:hypothetical protein
MPYDSTDPRAQLLTAVPAVAGIARPATYRELRVETADEQHPHGSATWWVRSQAMVIAHTDATPGDELTVEAVGESMLLVLDGAAVSIQSEHGSAAIGTDSVVVMPPGASSVRVERFGTLVRVFAAAIEPHLAARCANAGDYVTPDPNVADFVVWPDPPGGHAIRSYALGAYPPEPGRLGRIFRCSTVMVNVFEPDIEPRDPAKLSPHHHDDFEQVSLQIAGEYVHHMRVAWSPDSTTWRDDEHRQCTSPATVVIPPPLIHTTQALGDMRHFLIDVFAPPRHDFSARPGWVLNADDYPMPA